MATRDAQVPSGLLYGRLGARVFDRIAEKDPRVIRQQGPDLGENLFCDRLATDTANCLAKHHS